MSVLVDTSAWYALRVRGDRLHPDALRIIRSLAEESTMLLTTDWIFSETIALLQRRFGAREAIEAGRWILDNPSVHLRVLDKDLVRLSWDRFEKIGGRLSLVDCSSFALMDALRIEQAFAFDEDFTSEGFHLLR